MPSQHEYEMNMLSMKEESLARGSSWSGREPAWLQAQTDDRRHTILGLPVRDNVRRFFDSFRRDPGSHITPKAAINTMYGGSRASDEASTSDRLPSHESHRGAHYFDLRAANLGTANTLLSRELKGRHLQMIAIGGSIGRCLVPRSGGYFSFYFPLSVSHMSHPIC